MKPSIIVSILLVILMSCTSTSTSEQLATKKKDIALQLYSLREDIQKDYQGTIKKVAGMGYTAVEAANYNDGKFYGRTPEEFRSDIESLGMKVLSSHTGRGLKSEELAKKDFTEALKWWDQCIIDHKAAGMEYIVTPWMEVPATLQDLQTYCDYYNEIGRRCKVQGLSYGYHNHAHEFEKVEGKVMFDYMIENTDPANVFYQMDVYWVVRGGQSPVDYFNKYKNRFTLLHIKDHKELGQSGMVGFDAIFKNLDAAGVKHLIVEVESYNYTPEVSVKKSLEYLQECSLLK